MGCYNNSLGSYQKWFIGNDIRAILLDDEEIVNQVLLAEGVIIGNIPNTYYNLEGLTNDNIVDIIE